MILRQDCVPLLHAIDQPRSNLRHHLEIEAASLNRTYPGTLDYLEQDVSHAREETEAVGTNKKTPEKTTFFNLLLRI
ncbi:hypothetical protein GCK32_021016, partial [Trichostrongylus colubriformis]